MSLVLVGLNHRTAPIALRDRLAISASELPEALRRLRSAEAPIGEVVVLSTCNRLELYGVSANPAEAFHHLIEFLAHRARLPLNTLSTHLYCLTDRDAVAHLFRVASGLDSMVLGESEIAMQVKQAYLTALEQGAAGSLLNRLFQKALHSAKLIRSRTRIAEGEASVGSVVVRLAREVFGDQLARCRVLLWGAGKAAETTARHLIKHGVGELWVVNRTATKAQELASMCQGGWVSWEQALKRLTQVDIAIVCTQAPHYVLDAADMTCLMPQRGGRPLVLVDLAVPRNVDPQVAGQPGIRLYDIDALQQHAQRGVVQRMQEVERCEALVQEQVGHFSRWWQDASRVEETGCRSVLAASAA